MWNLNNSVLAIHGEYVHEFIDLIYANSSELIILCVSAQSFKEFSQLLNMVEEERRRLVRCFLFVFVC